MIWPMLSVHRIVKLQYNSDSFIDRHQHDYYHYVYVMEGTGEIEIAHHPYAMAKGMLFMIPMHTMHSIYSREKLTTVDIKFTCHDNIRAALTAFSGLWTELSPNEVNIIKGILSEAIAAEHYYVELINTRFQELLLRLLRRAANADKQQAQQGISAEIIEVGQGSGNQEKVNRNMDTTLEYIHRNAHEIISVGQLAERFGYSESYFSTIFKKEYGISPNRYINHVKIDRAKELMLHSGMSVTQISESLGFENIHYFSKLFKKITSLPPHEFIKSFNKDVIVNVSDDQRFIPPGRFEFQQKSRKAN